jgi:hypothetical protein
MTLLSEKPESLTLREQIQVCRQNAQEVERMAMAAHPDQKEEYKRIAAEWLKIAAELEKWGTDKSAIRTEIGGRA